MSETGKTSFDAARARSWEREVRQELNAVGALLVRVQSECNSDPAEDDTVLTEIDKMGHGLIEAFQNLGKQFDESMNVLDKVINEVEKAAQELSDNVKEYAAQFNLGGK